MGMEIIIIAVLALLLFGGKRMPEVLREAGKLSRGLQQARRELMDAVDREAADAAGGAKPVPRRETEDGRLSDAPPAVAGDAGAIIPVPEAATQAAGAADALHEGEVPPEYAEFATLPPVAEDGAESASAIPLERAESAAAPGGTRTPSA
jgi:Sec-independent protein translocase protein TatA